MRINPTLYAVLLPTLYAAHTVADHVVQTDHQAARKATSWRAMAGHVAGYQATQALAVGAVLAATGLRASRRGLLAGWLLSGVTHAILDRRWPVVAILRRTGSPGFASPRIRVHVPVSATGVPTETTATGPLPLHGPYLADQALHHGCLALAAALMAVEGRPSR